MAASRTITVEVPADVAGSRSADELSAELRRLVVLDAFRRGDVTSGRAALLLGLSLRGFFALCAACDIPTIEYDPGDYARELREIGARGY